MKNIFGKNKQECIKPQMMQLTLNNNNKNTQQQQMKSYFKDYADLLTFLLSTKFNKSNNFNNYIVIDKIVFPDCIITKNGYNFSIDKYNKFIQSKTIQMVNQHMLLIELKEKIEASKKRLSQYDYLRFGNCPKLNFIHRLFCNVINKFPHFKRLNGNDNNATEIVKVIVSQNLDVFFSIVTAMN